MSVNLRRNVRAALSTAIVLRGTDREGEAFEIRGRSVDFSRKGLGFVIPQGAVTRGCRVRISVPNKGEAEAVVEWTQPRGRDGYVRGGARIMNTRVNAGVRLAASALLCVALLSQVSLARPRKGSPGAAGTTCTMSLERMKSVLESKLGEWTFVSKSERAFVHVQHQQMSCELYSQTYENSAFYPDEKRRAAVTRWHWNTYHAKDEAVRTAAVESAEAVLGGN